MTRRLYPVISAPILETSQFPERVDEPKWHQRYSEPSRNIASSRAAKFLVAALAGYSGVIAPTQEGGFGTPGAHADWIQPLSEPIVKARKLPTNEQQTLAYAPTEIVSVDKWFAGLREPPVKKLFLSTANQQVIAFIDWQPIADSASQRWLTEFSVPTRRPVRVSGEFYLSPVNAEAEIITLDKWYEALSEPRQRSKWLEARYQPYQSYTGADPFPESVTADRWQIGLTDPTRRSVRLQTDPIYSPFVATAETITADKWYEELSQPVRRIPTRLGEFTYNTTEIVQVSKWYQELSQPTKLRLLPPTEQQAISFEVEPPIFEQFGWFVPLSEWPRQRLKVPFQQYLAYAEAAPFAESVTLDRWQIGLSEPRRPLYSGLGHWYQQAFTSSVFTPVAEITVGASTEEPGPCFTKVLLYQGIAYQPFPFPSAPTVFPDSWLTRWLEPKRVPRAQLWPDVVRAPTEIVLEPEWFEPLTERPVLRRLPVSEYQYLAFVKSDPFPEAVSSDRWLQGLSVPTRRKAFGYHTTVTWPTFFTGGATDLRVYTGWDYPLRREWKGFPTREQQAFAFVKAAPFGENVTVASWTQPYSTPVRRVRFTPQQSNISQARWEFATGPTTTVELLTSVVFTVVLPHRTSDGGAYGEFSYGEHPLDKPASFTIKVIKLLRDRIRVKIESIGDLLHIHKKKFKRLADSLPFGGSGKFGIKSGGGTTKVSAGKGDIKPKSGDALATPKSGRGNIRIKPDP